MLFDNIDYLPHSDLKGFAAATSARQEPFVLFWHEEAESALAMLSELRITGQWPAHLKGVVIYRWAHFAGLHTERNARQVLVRYGLDDGSVHIFAPEVADRPANYVVGLIKDFADACPTWPGEKPPFLKLDPKAPSRSRIIILLLEALVRRRPELEAEIFKPLSWEAIRQECERQSINCSKDPQPGVLRRISTELRRLDPDVALPCRACGRRGQLVHDELKQVIVGRSGSAATDFVANVARQLKEVLGTPPYLDLELAISHALVTFGLDHIKVEIMKIAEEMFAEHCAVEVLRIDSAATLLKVDQALQDKDFVRGAERITELFRCNVAWGVPL